MTVDLYIATLNEIKQLLGINDSQEDAQLTRWISGLQQRIADFCRRNLLREASATELFDGGRKSIYLSRYPVESVASVHVSAEQDWTATSEITSSNYRLHSDRGRIRYGLTGELVWPSGDQNVRIVYTGGFYACYATPSAAKYQMPEAIRRALAMQANHEWKHRDQLGITQINAGGASISANPSASLALAGVTLLPEVEESLNPYVRRLA